MRDINKILDILMYGVPGVDLTSVSVTWNFADTLVRVTCKAYSNKADIFTLNPLLYEMCAFANVRTHSTNEYFSDVELGIPLMLVDRLIAGLQDKQFYETVDEIIGE